MMRRRAIDALNALDAEGVSRDQMQAEFQLRTRCRSRFGLSAWLDNKSKIAPDPLASPWLVAARKALPRRLHSKNKVIFDLLRAGGRGDLAEIPMADRNWDVAIILPDEVEKFQRIDTVLVTSPPLSPLTGDLTTSTIVLSTAVQRLLTDTAVLAELKERSAQGAQSASASQTRFGNERQIAGNQEMMLQVLDRTPADHDLWSLIDRDEAALWARKPASEFRKAGEVSALGQAVSGLIWALEQPAPEGVVELRNFGDYQYTPIKGKKHNFGARTALIEPLAGIETDRRVAVERLRVSVESAMIGRHRTETFAYLISDVVKPSQRTLLDLGAGHCAFTLIASRLGYQTTAVDARSERVPADLGSARFVQSDVRDFDPRGFGVVAILGLLYHLDIDDQLTLLRRCAYGAPVIVETQVHAPEMIDEDQERPWHRIVNRHGYCGVEYPENQTAMASVGNAISFWHTEQSMIRLFAEAGFSGVTLIDPVFRSPIGARRFYLLSAGPGAPVQDRERGALQDAGV